MNPLVSILLRYIIAPLVIGIGAYFYGVGVGKDQCVANQVKVERKQTAQQTKALVKAQTTDQNAADKDVQRKATVREIYRDVPKIIAGDPVYRNVCVDDAGVQLLARAVAAANGSEPPAAGAVSASGPLQLTTDDGRPVNR
jgi:hypothetical protein